jgi:hypothetical protein
LKPHEVNYLTHDLELAAIVYELKSWRHFLYRAKCIWVIVDRHTKSAHFLAVNQKDNCGKLAEIYVNEIVNKHGVPKIIVSDRGSVFTLAFWKHLQSSLGSKLDFSIAITFKLEDK